MTVTFSSGVRWVPREALVVAVGAAPALVLARSAGGSKASGGGATTLPLFGNKSSTVPGGGSGGRRSRTRLAASGSSTSTCRAESLQDIDVYDTDQIDQNPKPVATDLKYNTASKSFSLHIPQYGTADDATLYGVAAGTKPTTVQSFHSLNTGGFANGAKCDRHGRHRRQRVGDLATIRWPTPRPPSSTRPTRATSTAAPPSPPHQLGRPSSSAFRSRSRT